MMVLLGRSNKELPFISWGGFTKEEERIKAAGVGFIDIDP